MSLADTGSVYLLGAGKMGMAMARGWIDAGLSTQSLTLIDPSPHETIIAYAKERGIALVAQIPATPPRVLVLAVKPQIMLDVLPSVKPSIDANTLVVSIAAGIAIKAFVAALGTERVVRTMPNTPAQVGKGVTGAVPAAGVNASDKKIADALLSASGLVAWFADEGQLDGVTSVSGSGPAYVFYFVEALAKAGAAHGLDPDQAMVLARQMVIGAAALMEADPTDAATLRQNVTSPGGTTAAALNVLMADDGLQPLLDKAVDAAFKRSIELGE